jgi:hypothetical protein
MRYDGTVVKTGMLAALIVVSAAAAPGAREPAPVRREGQAAVVTVPAVRLWTLVVIRNGS